MNKNVAKLLATLAALLLVALLAVPRARAQLDPGEHSFGVYQEGALVGEIYREDTDTRTYKEYWVLYPGYVYPSEKSVVETTIKPGLSFYSDAKDFFARVPWTRGSRYVSTLCSDGTTLLGR